MEFMSYIILLLVKQLSMIMISLSLQTWRHQGKRLKGKGAKQQDPDALRQVEGEESVWEQKSSPKCVATEGVKCSQKKRETWEIHVSAPGEVTSQPCLPAYVFSKLIF